MIELTNIPEVIYKASNGDTFTVNNHPFMFELSGDGSKCWLSKLPEDDHPFVHLRNDCGVALHTRESLVELLLLGEFIIY